MLYSRTLFIHYICDSFHLLNSNSKSTPLPPLSRLAVTSLFSMSVIPSVSYISSFVLYFRSHLKVESYDTCFYLSDLFHLVWSSLVTSLLLQMASFRSFYGWLVYSIVYMYHIFLFHSFVDGHLCYFHVLAIVNGVAIHLGVRISFWIIVLSV